MTWYKTGTVTVTNGSATVIGAGTVFVKNALAGDGFRGPDGIMYEVVNVDNDTQLTISPNYASATAAGQSYLIVPTQGRIIALSEGVTTLIDDFGAIRDGIGSGNFPDGTAASPALRFGADADTGIYRLGVNSFGFAVGGALAAHFSAQGRLIVGAGTANYRANVAEANPSRGIVADITNTHANPNGAMLSFTQNGINNWCIGQVPGVDAFAIYRGRNGAADGSEMLRVTGAGSVGIGTGAPAARLHILSGGEIQRLETTTARGGGACYQGFYDPSGVKGFCGYSAVDDGFDIWNSLNHQIRFGTGGSYRWAISSAGGFYPVADNAYTMGGSVNRVSEIYAVNGAINTSDARDKMWRGAPTEAELRAARRIAGELGFFQWNDALAEKGADGARLHFGVRAQAVWAIMADEGLIDPIEEGVDPTSKYAFLCWDKWDAIEPVDAVDAVLDEEGRVIAEARPAQPGRDAGERFGVRTDQLALFLIAAQEARIAALEAAA